MRGSFVVAKSREDRYFFNLKVGDGEVILTSRMYESRASALQGVASVRVNAWLDERYERRLAADGQHYFELKAGNHEVIGRSETYTGDQAAEDGIAAVKRVAPTADLINNT